MLLTNLSKLELINWKLSINVKLLPSVKAMYLSMLLGIAFIFRSFLSPFLSTYDLSFAILPICYIIKWLSYPLKLWNITGTLILSGFILSLLQHSSCADPR